MLAEVRHVRVVRRDDQDVGWPELPGLPCRPGAEVELDALDAGPEQLVNELKDRRGFLVGGVPTVIVRHLDEAESGAVKRARAEDALTLEPGQRMQPALVERLGGEVADRRRKTPRGRQEHSAIGGNGLVTIEKMLERRSTGAGRVTGPLRLIELLRIAEEHDGQRCLARCQHIGQRHLPGLVDEQDVHRLPQLLARPQPRGAAEQAAARWPQERDGILILAQPTIGEPSTGIGAPSSQR